MAPPSSTKNKDGKRDPEMHSSKKGNQWHFGMKSHIGVDADSGLVHTVRGTAGRVADVTEGNSLLHGVKTVVFADAGYQGADKRLDAVQGVRWQVAMLAGKCKKLDKASSPLMRSSTKSRNARPASVPRSSIHFASSSASSDL